MTTFTYDGVASSTISELDVLRVARPLAGDRRDQYVDVPGRAGFWLFEEAPGRRVIGLELAVTGETFAGRRAAVRSVADLLDRPGLVKLVVDDEPGIFHRVRLAAAPDVDEWLLGAQFSVELVAEPYGYAVASSSQSATATDNVAVTFTPPDTIGAPLELELTARGGTVTAFTLTVNGATLTYAAGGTGLAANGTLTVSTLSYTVCQGASTDTDLDGTFSPAALDMATVSGDFGELVAGVNSVLIDWTGTATTVAVVARWRRRYR